MSHPSLAYGPVMSRDQALALMNGGRVAQRLAFTPSGTVEPVRPRASVAGARWMAVRAARSGDPLAIPHAFANAKPLRVRSLVDDGSGLRVKDIIGS